MPSFRKHSPRFPRIYHGKERVSRAAPSHPVRRRGADARPPSRVAYLHGGCPHCRIIKLLTAIGETCGRREPTHEQDPAYERDYAHPRLRSRAGRLHGQGPFNATVARSRSSRDTSACAARPRIAAGWGIRRRPDETYHNTCRKVVTCRAADRLTAAGRRVRGRAHAHSNRCSHPDAERGRLHCGRGPEHRRHVHGQVRHD